MSGPNIGIIDGWTLAWPEIRIPAYRTGRVGAWELKRQVQPVLRGYFRGPRKPAPRIICCETTASGCR